MRPSCDAVTILFVRFDLAFQSNAYQYASQLSKVIVAIARVLHMIYKSRRAGLLANQWVIGHLFHIFEWFQGVKFAIHSGTIFPNAVIHQHRQQSRDFLNWLTSATSSPNFFYINPPPPLQILLFLSLPSGIWSIETIQRRLAWPLH